MIFPCVTSQYSPDHINLYRIVSLRIITYRNVSYRFRCSFSTAQVFSQMFRLNNNKYQVYNKMTFTQVFSQKDECSIFHEGNMYVCTIVRGCLDWLLFPEL